MTHPALPAELFHYTSSAGAIGLIRGNAWATMIHYLNDSLEFEYALNLTADVLLEELGDDRSKSVCEDYLRVIRRMAVYAFCLSESGDSLSQWRAYCPSDGGYSVAFDSRRLRAIAETQRFELVKCEYDVVKQKELLRPAVRALIDTASTLSEYAQGIDLHVNLEKPFKFHQVAAALKHPSFEEEQEWRLVSASVDNPIRYRPQSGLVIPYAEVAVKDEESSSVSGIVVGPHRHSEIAARAIRFISSDELGWPLKVTHSESPFRVL